MFNFMANQERLSVAESSGTDQATPQWKALFGSWYALAVPE
ncbi:hypothetical protein [Idiomarina sp. HP20-50]|nr:hypothetical protein [Idiomarina sp. HP20-50]MDV6316271.1 hypothetical protein [Idiomarina sp. HP20-50]